MYPSLYHAFLDLFGLDWPALKMVNSFGFFVAVAFLVGSALMSRELKRKAKEGLFRREFRERTIGKAAPWSDVLFNAGVGFILGWKIIFLIHNASELFSGQAKPTDFIFSGAGYPILGVVLAAVFGGWRWYAAHKNKLDEPRVEQVEFPIWEYTGNITLVAAIGGIIGAKFFHLFENPDEFMQFFKEPSIDNFLSGLTIYGGLIMGGLSVWVYARTIKLPMGHLCDAAAPGLMLTYGIGRIGCHVSGDGDWGIANAKACPSWLPDWLWSYRYPNNVNAVRFENPDGGYAGKIIQPDNEFGWEIYDGYGTYLDPGVYPTPLYEMIMASVIFVVLWKLRKRWKAPLLIFALYMMANGVERFFIEKIRVNNRIPWIQRTFDAEVTQAEVISTSFFLVGLVLFIYVWKNRAKLAIKYGPVQTEPPATASGSPES